MLLMLKDISEEKFHIEISEMKITVFDFVVFHSSCTQVLMDWINNCLCGQRIIVKDLQEDLFDGQVLQKLLETVGEIRMQVNSLRLFCILKLHN